jgi:hypothetical protein
MASYGRENAFIAGFSALLLTLDFTPQEKEALLVYLVQYGIDLYGLVAEGHSGWPGHGGHGSGRKLPIVLAGLLLNEPLMQRAQAYFGEDLQTIWVEETPPAGTYTRSWHRKPERVVFAGHAGLSGESLHPGWGPYEHLPPAAWKDVIGEEYRRCCTSVSWVGEALAARLIPGLEIAWDHPPFFAYVDRWMMSADDPQDLEAIRIATGWQVTEDFMQGNAWKILSGGGYHETHRTFVDDMWAAYRFRPRFEEIGRAGDQSFAFTVRNLAPGSTAFVQATTLAQFPIWTTIATNTAAEGSFTFEDNGGTKQGARFYRIRTSP